MSPKVSVITATYHRPDLLRRCIQSVKNNIFQDYEHIIVSDHCPYAESVYNEFKEDVRIKFFQVQTPHEKSQGSIAKNIGIENAQAEFICYCDDDNIFLPNHLIVLYNVITKTKSDLVYSCCWSINLKDEFEILNRTLSEIENMPPIPKKFKNAYIDYDSFKCVVDEYHSIINHDMLTVIHSKSAIEKIGMWKVCTDKELARQNNIGEDRYLMNRFRNEGYKIKYIKDITCVYYARWDRSDNYKLTVQNNFKINEG